MNTFWREPSPPMIEIQGTAEFAGRNATEVAVQNSNRTKAGASQYRHHRLMGGRVHCTGSSQPPRCFRRLTTCLPPRSTGPTCTSGLVVNRPSVRKGPDRDLRGGYYPCDPDYEGIETACGEPLRNNICGTTTSYLKVHAAQGGPIGRVHLASRRKGLTPRETVRDLHRG